MCLSAQVLSQTPSGTLPHHSLETVEQLPPEQLPPPRALKGIGNLHVPITASPEAQRWFDQGINLHHDFWDYEAARAFEQSIRVDPSCAMCYWGLYKAESFYHSNSPSYAAPALAKAVSLQDGVTDRERLYIRATSADFPQAAELWRNLTRQYPNDLHAQILLALTLQDGVDEQGEPRRGQQEALEILEHVMTADPENSAAHHYYVHPRHQGMWFTCPATSSFDSVTTPEPSEHSPRLSESTSATCRSSTSGQTTIGTTCTI